MIGLSAGLFPQHEDMPLTAGNRLGHHDVTALIVHSPPLRKPLSERFLIAL